MRRTLIVLFFLATLASLLFYLSSPSSSKIIVPASENQKEKYQSIEIGKKLPRSSLKIPAIEVVVPKISEGVAAEKKSDEIKTEVKKIYQDSYLLFETPYVNGKPSGIGKQYYPSGKLRGFETYVNGYAEGKYETYYESGAIESKGVHFKGGVPKSTYSYDESGNLLRLCHRKLKKDYDPDKLIGNESYSKLAPIIKRIQYYKNGDIRDEEILDQAKQIRTIKSFHENGQLKSEGIYTKYEPPDHAFSKTLAVGTEKHFNQYGGLIKQIEYHEDGTQTEKVFGEEK